MKKLVLLFALLVSTFSVYATEGENINWFQGTFDQALAESASQGKLLFIDFYADWCGPCKKMKNEVFPQPSIYEFINNHFIAYQINTDQDVEKVAKKYGVRAIPTLLFVKDDSTEFKKLVGSRPADKFLVELKEIAVSYYGPQSVEE